LGDWLIEKWILGQNRLETPDLTYQHCSSNIFIRYIA